MKKIGTLFTFLLLSYAGMSQLNCDTLCNETVAPNSYKILNNPGEIYSETNDPANSAIMTCEVLCEIEANRKKYDDYILRFQGLIILIYSEETIINAPVENQ